LVGRPSASSSSSVSSFFFSFFFSPERIIKSQVLWSREDADAEGIYNTSIPFFFPESFFIFCVCVRDNRWRRKMFWHDKRFSVMFDNFLFFFFFFFMRVFDSIVSLIVVVIFFFFSLDSSAVFFFLQLLLLSDCTPCRRLRRWLSTFLLLLLFVEAFKLW
jgi:hypothetical protein